MLTPHSFKLISRVWLEVTESRLIASNERLFPSKVFFWGGGKGERKEGEQGDVKSLLRDYWRTVYKNTCGLQRTIGVPTCKLGLSWLNN